MLTFHWVINIFSIVILIIIKFAYTKYGKSANNQYKLFSWILYIVMILLFFESPSRYDGLIDSFYPVFNQIGNYMLFLFSPILPSLWLILVYLQTYNDLKSLKKIIIILVMINIIHFAILVGTYFHGWFFGFSEANIYYRGPLFALSPLTTLALLIIAFFIPIYKRKNIQKNLLVPFLIFPLPAIFGVFMQAVVYGIDFSLKGVTISILFYFIFVLSHQMTIDYLTGTYNRRGLDDYLNKLINRANQSDSFTAIMLDLDNFKSVNDKFGHSVGDEALKMTVNLIRSCLSNQDFMARYGGDEFFIVMETKDKSIVNKVVVKLNQCFTKFNASNEKPYKITYSLGILTYDPIIDGNLNNFKKRIDDLMYSHKYISSGGQK